MKIEIHFPTKTFDTSHSANRCKVFEFHVPQDGVEAAELAFHITNAPEECLDDDCRGIAESYRAKGLRSMSIGDVAKVGSKYYLCEPCGWSEIEILDEHHETEYKKS